MTERRPNVTEEDINRFVDGRLDAGRQAEVAEYLAEDPDTRHKASDFQRLNTLLHTQYDQVLEEPVPPSLLRAAAKGRPSHPTSPWRIARVAAVVFFSVAVGGIGGWLARDSIERPARWSDFARQAAVAHLVYAPDAKRPVEVKADQETQLLAWLSRRLGAPIRAPNLAKVGYRLIGGRVLPTSDGSAAQLMYENEGGARVTLYLRTDLRNHREIKFQITRDRDVNVWYWLDGPRGYALAGEIDQYELLNIAQVLYDEIGS